MGYTIRTERYRYTIWMDQEADKAYASELYDYQIDPLETTSYIKDEQYDPVIQKLDSILIRRIKTPSTKRH